MGRNEEIGIKMTLKIGDGRGLSEGYIFAMESHIKGRNSREERGNQIGLIETKATLSSS